MKLYKYYPDNVNSFKSLSVRGLWCHYPDKMNDPADCLGYLDRDIAEKDIKIFKDYFLKSKSNDFTKIKDFSKDKIVDFLNKVRKKNIEKFAFCSLSESFDDILMWSHYASSHSGFVVELDFDESQIDHHFQKVNYTNVLPGLDVNKIAKFLCDEDNSVNCFLEDISLKAEVWGNEKEWRIWRDKPSYFHYERYNIKNVFFGVNSTIETKSIVAKLVGELNKDVLFHFMKFNHNPIKLIYTS
ncbi:DUF2971 domain-containing protein [Flavobacterium beibuense]|uniref:DUF2971 domain containing protein n=1 Tax=Flavobacterium beibuense TaxID=657326 RepID=A0A444W7A3_9FLAO|nr:DUF2971 domain-containing protein [Flavobacterium beibuense]RYJ41556.1 DUF2971 domain containing protein [Flavobacterium beibuense]